MMFNVEPGRGGLAAWKNLGWRMYSLLLPLLLLASLQLRWNAFFGSYRMFATDDVRSPQPRMQRQDPHGSILDRMKPFCQRWSSADAHNRTLRPFDIWFTHHPSWIVANETDDKFCVERDESDPLRRGMMQLYANQFLSSCDTVHIRYMWSSGWGADFSNLQGGMVHAMYGGVPFVAEVPEYPWHYTANKDDHSNLTCPAGDTTCYFLPYHGCPSWQELRDSEDVEVIEEEDEEGNLDPDFSGPVDVYEEMGSEAYFFLTRRQLWLRRAVFDYKQQFRAHANIGPDYTDCTVVHVRRSDVVLHGEDSRRYFPVADYVKLIPEDRLNNPKHYIFLLTDDSNAIDEAHEFFPKLRWKYFDRPRHKGSSGGWENQTPSRNPALEVITLLATFDLAQECSAMVHGSSSFAELIHHHMLHSQKHSSIERYKVDQKVKVHLSTNEKSEKELEKSLEKLRMKKKGIHLPSNDASEPPKLEKVKGISKSKAGKRSRRKREESTSTSTAGRNGCLDENSGIIILNMLGLLANDLFEAAFARRMAAELGCGWHVIYRSGWNSAFPTDETDKCFPNALADNNNRREGASNRTVAAIQRIVNSTKAKGKSKKFDLATLTQALNYNEIEPNKHPGWDDTDNKANKLVSEWVDSLGEAAITVEHDVYDFKGDKVDQLVSTLKGPNSKIQVLNLGAFFIHFDWMKNSMDLISNWLHIDPSCCTTPAPPKGAIVIHIRDFEPEDDDKNKHISVGVFRDIIKRYSKSTKNDRKVIVVCQPKSVDGDIVQSLVKEFGAVVQTGSNNIDAFCILRRASGLIIPSTSSSFSELAALLAEHNNKNVQVHYPTHTLDYPMVTLNVPTWKYHVTNENNTGIAEFDVDHQRLKTDQA